MVCPEVGMIFTSNDISSLYPSTVTMTQTKPFQKVEEAIVDGELWHTVYTQSGSEVYKWLHKQESIVETGTSWAVYSYFDVPDKIYMMLILRFQ
jgi:hypothetical protein